MHKFRNLQDLQKYSQIRVTSDRIAAESKIHPYPLPPLAITYIRSVMVMVLVFVVPLYKPKGVWLMSEGTVNVRLLSNEGDGYASDIPIARGMSLATFINLHAPNAKGKEYEKMVNRRPAAAASVLEEGDVVTLTPRNYKSA